MGIDLIASHWRRAARSDLFSLALGDGTGEALRVVLEAHDTADPSQVADYFDTDVSSEAVAEAYAEIVTTSRQRLDTKHPEDLIRVWRAGDLSEDVVSVTTKPGGHRVFGQATEYLVHKADVLADVDALVPAGTFGEQELLVRSSGLVAVERRTAAKHMRAKFPGKCKTCGGRVERGDWIYYDGTVRCDHCGEGSDQPRRQPMIDCPFHGRVPDEGWHEDCFTDWRLTHGSFSGSFRQATQGPVGPNGDNKVYFGLLEKGYHVASDQDVILAYQKPYDHDGIQCLGAVAFDSQHLVTIYVLDAARGLGIAGQLLRHMDQHVGRQLPDDGLRTRPGAGLLNHLNRPKSEFRKWVSERDALRPVQRLVGFGSFGWSEDEVIAKVFNP